MKKLLSLDGGAVKGLRTLQVLKFIEARTGKRIYDSFDVVAGNSTGGIIALALAEMSAAEVEAFYLKLLPRIFTRSTWRAIKTLGGAAGAKYDVDELQQALRRVFKDALTHPRALVTTFDTTTWAPHIIDGDDMWPAYDAALATSAAPTYFDPHVYKGHVYWDGGLTSNDPALVALAWSGIQPADALVLSLGTGSSQWGYPAAKVQAWKPLEMIAPALSACMDGGGELADSTLHHLLPEGQYLRVQSAFHNDAMDDASPTNLRVLQLDGKVMVQQFKPDLDEMIRKLS